MAVSTADIDRDCGAVFKVLHSLLPMFPGDLARDPQPYTRQRDVQSGECGSGKTGRLADSNEPADMTSLCPSENVSIAAFALYFASRDVGGEGLAPRF